MKIEEIIKAALAYYPSGILHEEAKVPAFVRGAKWADKTMLDRACEWLKQNMYVEHIFEYDEDDEPVQYVCASAIDSVEEFITAFMQAMEGGVE